MTDFKYIRRHTFLPEKNIIPYEHHNSPSDTLTQDSRSPKNHRYTGINQVYFPPQEFTLKTYIARLTLTTKNQISKGVLPDIYMNDIQEKIPISAPFLSPLLTNAMFFKNEIWVNYGHEIKNVLGKYEISVENLTVNMDHIWDHLILLQENILIQNIEGKILRKYNQIGPFLSTKNTAFINASQNQINLWDIRTSKPVQNILYEYGNRQPILQENLIELGENSCYDLKKQTIRDWVKEGVDQEGMVWKQGDKVGDLGEKILAYRDDNLLVGNGWVAEYQLEDMKWKKVLEGKLKKVIEKRNSTQ